MDVILNIFSFVVVAILTFTGQLWLIAQIEPPGGKIVRSVLLILAILIAMLFGWASTQTAPEDARAALDTVISCDMTV